MFHPVGVENRTPKEFHIIARGNAPGKTVLIAPSGTLKGCHIVARGNAPGSKRS